MSFGKFKDDSSSDKSVSSSGSSSPFAGSSSPSKNEAFLGKGTRVVGSLSFSGPVELDGMVEGEVISKDTLTIGESAVVSAKVHGSEILVRGTVTGDIVASRKLSLKKPARVTGNISAPTLSIEDGVQFEGKCTMTSSTGTSSTGTSSSQVSGASTSHSGSSSGGSSSVDPKVSSGVSAERSGASRP